MRGVEKSILPKISQTYATMMTLDTVIPYLKKIQNVHNHVTHPLSSADISFSPEVSSNILIQFPILLIFFESLKVVFINIVETLMLSAKLAILGLFKI